MKFYYIYKSLAHPETNGYVQPFTLKERLMHVKEAERRLGSGFTWLCDGMTNAIKHALGDAPNSEFVIDPAGTIVRKRGWSNPKLLREDLADLIGPVENPTKVSDLDMKTIPPPQVSAEGVVKKLERPRTMNAVRIEPAIADSKLPFFVKLRAEADQPLMQTGKGALYLGFHLDPIYPVHWNNLAKPIAVDIECPAGMTVTPNTLTGPKVEVPGDADPREFLVDVDAAGVKEPIRLTVKYFACNDDEGWCVPATQRYAVYLEVDPDGGRVSGGRSRPGGQRPPGARAGQGGRQRGQGMPGQPSAGPPGMQGTQMAQGRLLHVDAQKRTLTLRTRDGERTFRVPKGATLMRDRKRVDLDRFQADDAVRLRYTPADEGAPIVRGMMARPMPSGRSPY